MTSKAACLHLTNERRQQLRQHAHEVDPADVADKSLIEAIEDQLPDATWLEAALLAGYVPYPESPELLVRSLQLFFLQEADAAMEMGAPGDAEGWLAGGIEMWSSLQRVVLDLSDECHRRLSDLVIESRAEVPS